MRVNKLLIAGLPELLSSEGQAATDDPQATKVLLTRNTGESTVGYGSEGAVD